MDILILGFFRLFCVITLVLLLRLLRKQGGFRNRIHWRQPPSPSGNRKVGSPVEGRPGGSRSAEANLRDAVDEDPQVRLLQADVARLEAELVQLPHMQLLQEQEAGREAQEKALLNRFKVLSGELLEAAQTD